MNKKNKWGGKRVNAGAKKSFDKRVNLNVSAPQSVIVIHGKERLKVACYMAMNLIHEEQKCPECGGKMIDESPIILSSFPPKKYMTCMKCNKKK